MTSFHCKNCDLEIKDDKGCFKRGCVNLEVSVDTQLDNIQWSMVVHRADPNFYYQCNLI